MKEKIKTYAQIAKKYGFKAFKAISKLVSFMVKLAFALFIVVSLFITWLVIEDSIITAECIKKCQEEHWEGSCNGNCS